MFLPVSISDTLGKYRLIFQLLSQDNSNAHSWDVQRKRCISICTLSDRLQQCDDRHHVPTWQKAHLRWVPSGKHTYIYIYIAIENGHRNS